MSFIDGMVGNLEKMIEGLKKVAEEKRKEAKSYEGVLQGFQWLKTLKDKDNVSWEDVERAMKLTCYNHFAGCCGPSKKCPYQFSICEALGVDPEELYEVKRRAVDKWLKKVNASRAKKPLLTEEH